MTTRRFRALLGQALLAAGLASASGAVLADPYRLLLGARADLSAGEVFVATYDSYGALIGSPAAVGGDFSGIDIGAGYVASALTFDGQYRLMLSARTDQSAGQDIFFATYATYADLIASPQAVGGDFSGIDIGAGYVATGLAYDGKYRLMLTTRTDSGAGTEVFIATYDTFADMVASPPAVGGSFSGIDVGANYMATGLTYDGKYRLMLSTRSDGASGNDVFVATYDTFADLVASPAAVGGDFSGIDISSSYQARGFTVEFAPTPPIPEPGTWAMLGLGLALIVAVGARRNAAAPQPA